MSSTDTQGPAATETSHRLSRPTIEQLMAQVVESAPNGVAVTMPDGRIVLANAELERMFERPRETIIDTSIERLLPERFRPAHAKMRALRERNAAVHAVGSGRELMGLRANGAEFPIEIGINQLRSPDVTLLVETIVDISVRKRLERMFQRIVEAAPCAMIMIDIAGRIVLVNPQTESMFGYERTELIGSPLEMLLPERLRAAHSTLRAEFSLAPAIRQMGVDRDLTGRRKDGSEFPVEIGLNPVATEDGGLVVAAVTDITRRYALQLELRQANANLEEFTYAASHDLKSPLRGIADLVTWIGEDLGPSASADVKRNLGRVEDRVRRLGCVIDDLLAYAHAGTSAHEEASVDLRALVEDILELLPRPAGFRFSVRIDVERLQTNKAPLESVLRNLIGNAVKHHDQPTGHIEIRAEDAGRYCLISVADDGPGIPVGSQLRVFRMFQSLAKSKDHSGIGLALSKRLVETHGGTITLESHQGKRGSIFCVKWPRFPWRATDAR